MKKLIFSLAAVLFSFMSYAQIVGTWKTIDDETGKAKSIMRIYKKTDGKYYGEIKELLIKPENETCVKCTGKLKDKPLVGLEILQKLAIDGDGWSGGTITDPANGKTYKCKAVINADGNLEVRGYVGFSLLGRTQTWIKD